MKIDFGKFMRLCQLEKTLKCFFLTFFISSCSHEVINDRLMEREIKPAWLKVDLAFALRGKDDAYLTHPFYDVEPNKTDLENRSEIRYISIMPENSKSEFKLDLLSGSLYKVRKFCKTEDIWQNYSSKIELPNFDLGLIPQTLDQNGEPLKIIIFKKSKDIGKFEHSIAHYHNAKILGSILIENCESYPCTTHDRWKQTQVLVGVNKLDPEFSRITNFADLKKAVDWKYTKAFFVNSFGSHQVGDKFYPAYRINSELGLSDTLKNYKTRNKQIDMVGQAKFRDTCFELYNEFYGNILRIRKLENSQQEEFLKYFKSFYAKDSRQFYSCQKQIRPANINEDAERHWLFTFVSAFVNLERNGLYYSCYEKGWANNARIDESTFYIDQVKEINRCRAKDFEKSFDRSINGMSLLKNQLNKFFHYIEYDTVADGSHQKIYSWITDDLRKIPCEADNSNAEVFPQDVVWPAFNEDQAKTIQ